jgi:thiopurine S-methyltransferase (Se/Te detoxification family)
MKAEFWHQRWRSGETRFHETQANPLLVRHFEALPPSAGGRVFVPLCGKSLDIAWLLDRGRRVVGAELSHEAVEQLFAELGVEPVRQEKGSLVKFSAEGIDIFAGDIFDLNPEVLGPVDAVYDRAALVALPEEMRASYASHLVKITRGAPQLLISYEYEQEKMPGPPFDVREPEIRRHYAASHDIHLLEREEMTDGLKNICPAQQAVWLLQPAGRKADRPEIQRRRIRMAGLSLAVLLPSLGTSSANLILPALSEEFAASLQQVQWIVTAYLVSITALIAGAGRLGDLAGRRLLLLAGILMFVGASLLAGLAPSLPLLILTRALQGAGAALMMAMAAALMGDAVGAGKGGSAMGLLGALSAAGTAAGPLLGGVLVSAFGWRMTFFINLPLGLLAWLLIFWGIPKELGRKVGKPRHLDHPGMLLLIVTIVFYALSMSLGKGRPGLVNGLLLLASTVLAAVFVKRDRLSSSPWIPARILRSREHQAGLLLSLLVATVLMTTLVVGPFYLSRALHLPPAKVGLVLSVGPLVVALMGVPAGRLVDRHGTHIMSLAGLLLIGAGTLALALFPMSSGIPGYVIPLIVLTAGYATFQTANTTSMMVAAVASERGLMSGLLNLSRNLGLITGSSVMTGLFAVLSGGEEAQAGLPEAVAQGMRQTYVLALGIALAGVIMTMVVHSRAGQSSASARGG